MFGLRAICLILSLSSDKIFTNPSADNQYQPYLPTYQYRSFLPRNSQHFDIKVITMNVLGHKFPFPPAMRASEEKDTRINATLDYLRNSDIDVIYMQEVWYFSDFKKLQKIYPYSSHFGTPNNIFCPQIRY